jgi:uncharacterized protein (TIGR03000 family)
MRAVMSGVVFLLGASIAVAQPPKARAELPRTMPELPAAPLAEKTTAALIKIKVPENATVWFENQKMTQSGPTRMFQSPALEAKKTYYYKVKVSWPTGVGTMAKDFVTEQEVAVRGGETTTVDFTPLANHTKQVKPTTTKEMIRQAAHKTPPPARKGNQKNDE